MTAQTLTSLGNDIFLIENVLDAMVCQQMIETAQCHGFDSAGILMDQVHNRVRNSDLLALGDSHPLLASANDLLHSKIGIVQKLLYQEYGIKFLYAEPCSILRYGEGQFYKRHVDNILLASRFQELEHGIPTRDISIVGYLNDDFEGGETYFDRQNIKVKPLAGAALVFPAYFSHPHQSLPVTKGHKYVFTSWLFR
jgi:prolyl 4-hydroxylase